VHHSGSGWLARPSPWGTFTSYSLPASWRTPVWVNRTRLPDEYEDRPATRTVANLAALASLTV
jgi:hypothetical protein